MLACMTASVRAGVTAQLQCLGMYPLVRPSGKRLIAQSEEFLARFGQLRIASFHTLRLLATIVSAGSDDVHSLVQVAARLGTSVDIPGMHTSGGALPLT